MLKKKKFLFLIPFFVFSYGCSTNTTNKAEVVDIIPLNKIKKHEEHVIPIEKKPELKSSDISGNITEEISKNLTTLSEQEDVVAKAFNLKPLPKEEFLLDFSKWVLLDVNDSKSFSDYKLEDGKMIINMREGYEVFKIASQKSKNKIPFELRTRKEGKRFLSEIVFTVPEYSDRYIIKLGNRANKKSYIVMQPMEY